MKPIEKEDSRTKVTLMMEDIDIRNLESAAAMAGTNRASAIINALSIYRDLLEAQVKKGRILIEDRRGRLVEINLL